MIQTVLGPVSAQNLGITLCHEHVFCGSGDMARALGSRFYDRETLAQHAAVQLREAKERYGLTTVFDGTPIDIGRDAALMVRASQLSGINIVASTGLYYDERSFLGGKRSEALAEWFLRECREGMEDTWNTEKPVYPGLLKCATGPQGITEQNRMVLTALGITQRESGLPMFCHNEHWLSTAPEQLDVLEAAGADMTRIIVGHASDSRDIPYLESLLYRGVYLGFDRIFCQPEQADTLCCLLDKGYGDQILLSRDGAAYLDFGDRSWESEMRREENTFCTVLGGFLPMLRERGVEDGELHKMLVENPARLFG